MAGPVGWMIAVLCTAALTGCGSPTPAQPAAPPSPAARPDASADQSGSAVPSTPAAAVQRCHTRQLSARLGPRTGMGGGQSWMPLTYTNTSAQTCLLRGVPGVDLHGPNDPNGPVYSLRRQPTGQQDVVLRPGSSGSARLVVLSDTEGSVGSGGSTNWVPTQLVTIPPGETSPLTVAWPAKLTVSRQDEATHPGSWVQNITPG
jgi:hypothetical protein